MVTDKAKRVQHFHYETVKTLMELLAASGLNHPDDLRPWHILRRTSQFDVHHYGEMFHYLNSGELLQEPLPKGYARAVSAASSQTFGHVSPDETHKAPARSK